MPLGARIGAKDVETVDGGPVSSSERWGCPLCGAVYPPDLDACPIDGEPLLTLSWIHTQADALVGAVIQGRYEVESVLGKGGMGTVYQVRHKALGKRFALKVLRREVAIDADSVQRFMQEAQIAATVKHPNLADVSDYGEITGADVPALGTARLPFFVMEMLKGQSLGERLRDKGSIDAALAAEVLRQCAIGLAAAHAEGIVHRDLKPDNIFLTEVEGKLVCKILDFGVAKILSKAKLTKAGTVFGTPCYMAPEQASGGTLDGRTDLYALGVVLYEALSGRVPFSAETHMGVLTKHVFEVPEPIEMVVADSSKLGALGPIIMRCLEKDPDERYADALDLARTVDEAAKSGFVMPRERPAPAMRLREPAPVVARPTPRPTVDANKGRWLVIAAGATLLAFAGGAILLMQTGPKEVGGASSAAAAAPSALAKPAPVGATSSSPPGVPLATSQVSSVAASPSAGPTGSASATPSPSASAHQGAPGGGLVKAPASSTRRPSDVVDTW